MKPGSPYAFAFPIAAATAMSALAFAQPDLEGIWGIDPSLFRQYAEAQYTEEGQRRVDAYNPSTDDPSYWCIPSGLGRAWDEPDTNVEIVQMEDRVVIRYEMSLVSQQLIE